MCIRDSFLAGVDDLLGNVGRDDLIVIELHGEVAAAAGDGAKLGGVAQHFSVGNVHGDGGVTLLGFHALDVSPAGVHIAQHVTHVFFGYHDLRSHDRLVQHG